MAGWVCGPEENPREGAGRSESHRRFWPQGDSFLFLLCGMMGCGRDGLWTSMWLIMSSSQLSLLGNIFSETLG